MSQITCHVSASYDVTLSTVTFSNFPTRGSVHVFILTWTHRKSHNDQLDSVLTGLFSCAFVFPHDCLLSSVFCLLSSVFLFAHQDFAYHGIAAFFYLSASVALAKVTLDMKDGSSFQNYQLDISAVVSHHPVPTNQPNKRDLNLKQSPLIGSEVVVSKPSLVLDQH